MSSEEGQFQVQGYNIVTILKRLEAATSRLEDITVFQEQVNKKRLGSGEPQAGEDAATSTIAASESGATSKSIEGTSSVATAAGAPAPAIVEEKAKSVVVFEQLVNDHIIPFVTSSKSVDEPVGQAAQLLADAFVAQGKFLEIVSKSKKPEMSDPNFINLLSPMNEKISKIIEIKDVNRRSTFFNHLNTISEGAPVLGWIVSETPISLIPEFKDSAKFWSDRVLKEYREKDKAHVDWVNQFMNIFDELKTYVKEYHATGPSWNSKGKPLAEAIKQAEAQAAPVAASSSGAPPPPPPPPPPPANLFDDDKSAGGAAAPAGGINAVFAELNQGSAITSGLKKVDKSEMTHKNPELRKHAPVVPKKPTKPSTLSSTPPPSAQATATKKKPATKDLVDGTKWVIQNYTKSDISEPIVIEVEMHQSVFIGNCSDITIQLKGKANAVSISETKGCGIVIDSLISGVDIIKSTKYGLQVMGLVPMISIDKSDEGALYLSKDSVDADIQVFTSSTTALNINVPEQDGDYQELAVPEQFVHRIKGGKLSSEIVEHAG
ncbi:SRV2 [[Candida] subhashii]|uniref:Adenylyl cyclase-associated protein n=1 Tax=[Candida] subhashii TaxID=561895 RepID=A0A8J5R6I3_9ASCO|nr:SRV2 [[Candida] subhashii]KAG7665785.1 SRV2 [[Candida] subhashii]